MTADTMTITDWTPPQSIGTGYKIKIVDANDSTVSITSPAFKVQGKLTLTAPLTSATWAIGETRDITWDINQGNVANVKILGSKSGNFTGGTDEFTITASTQADNVVAFNPANPDPRGKGKYTWTLVDTYAGGSILVGPPAALGLMDSSCMIWARRLTTRRTNALEKMTNTNITRTAMMRS